MVYSRSSNKQRDAVRAGAVLRARRVCFCIADMAGGVKATNGGGIHVHGSLEHVGAAASGTSDFRYLMRVRVKLKHKSFR